MRWICLTSGSCRGRWWSSLRGSRRTSSEKGGTKVVGKVGAAGRRGEEVGEESEVSRVGLDGRGCIVGIGEETVGERYTEREGVKMI